MYLENLFKAQFMKSEDMNPLNGKVIIIDSRLLHSVENVIFIERILCNMTGYPNLKAEVSVYTCMGR